MKLDSWGKYPSVEHRQVLTPGWLPTELPFSDSETYLCYGQGRSYGDSCLNADGSLLRTTDLNRFISFDTETGVLRAESGVTLEEIQKVAVPRGWFIPVSPGTKYVSLGGAIANDVHGKNHHTSGTFGCHVRRMALLRSDQGIVECAPDENEELFCATVAGLGLTGCILWAEIQLKPVKGPYIDLETIAFGSLDEFWEISKASDQDFEYTVSWIDCVSTGDAFGRGIFMRGNHSEQADKGERKPFWKDFLRVPLHFPEWTLNNFSMQAFNTAYFHAGKTRAGKKVVHYDPFFYPLDAISDWNKIYGKRGFLQFQCVVPSENNNAAIKGLLSKVVEAGNASFLAVIKEFGNVASPGMLSFPQQGITICMDFPYRGERSLELFHRLEDHVAEAGGRLYPAKDACMTSDHFKAFYPNSTEFKRHIDPRCSSSFWRRVMGEELI